MRKKFVYFVLIPFIIVAIILYLFIESWIESGLEYAGEKIVGAKVEIDNLDLSLFPIGIEFQRLQVTNPDDGWKNLFETGKVKFALDFGLLLRGKYIIESMEINNLIFGTKRTTYGILPKPPKKEEQKPSEPSIVDLYVAQKAEKIQTHFDIEKIKNELKIDSLVNPQNLHTLKHIDSIKNMVINAEKEWNITLEEIEGTKKRITELEATIKSIDVNVIKDIQTATETLNKTKKALETAQEVRTTFIERKKTLTENVDQFKEAINTIDDVIKEDYARIVSMAKLPDVSLSGLSHMIVGNEMIDEAMAYLKYAEKASAIIKNSPDKPPFEKPKRMEGQTIHFPTEKTYPKFWIKHIRISGGTDKKQDPNYFYAKGEVKNITNDQRITKQPLTIDLLATRGNVVTLTMNFLFDRTKNEKYDRYNLQLTGLPVATMNFGRSDFLPSKLTNVKLRSGVLVEVPSRGFEAKAKVLLYNMKVEFEKLPTTIVERIVYDILSPINSINSQIRLWQREQKLDIAFETDLDDQLTNRVKQVIGAELARIQKEIRDKINNEISSRRKELESMYNQQRDMVFSKVKEYETIVNEKIAMIEKKKKELEQRIEEEKNKKTGEIKKRAEDTVKDLLRKK